MERRRRTGWRVGKEKRQDRSEGGQEERMIDLQSPLLAKVISQT